ncbi:MFS transporter [Sphingobacterium sp. Mn56C]|uniref:MFS transporter n=1 Tax=Sphingobacterium sp. Mn56C TaxID=3395261 RepID=UPI003BCD3C93
MINQSIGNYRWTICALLFFATTINYLDRQVLSLLHPTLEEEFGWSKSDYANVTAAFQFSYALSMLFAGRFIDRLGTKKGFAIAIVLWSFGAIIHAYSIEIGYSAAAILAKLGFAGLSVSILGFSISRVVLGIGESGNFPAAIKTTAEYFPKRERALATGIFNSGSNIGAVLAPLTVPWMAVKWGWQSAFIVVGVVGFIWLVFWWIFYDKPEEQKRLSRAELAHINSDADGDVAAPSLDPQTASLSKTSWYRLLSFKQTWAYVLGKFMTDGVWWFFLFWLPSYLKDQYHMTGTDIMLPLAVLYSMTMVGSIGGGWFPMYYINKGYKAYDGRMKAMFIIALFPLVVLLAQPFGGVSYWLPVVLIGVGASAHQAWSANIFTTVSDMFPKHTVATVVGIGGMAGGMGGVVLSKLGGWLFDKYQQLGSIETGYTIMFTICALSYIAAWTVMKLLVPKMRVIVSV